MTPFNLPPAPTDFRHGLKALRDDRSFLPRDKDEQNWQADLREVLYADLLRLCDGDAVRATRTLIDFVGSLIGEAVFYTGAQGIDEFNRAVARHESRFRLVLEWRPK
jgi:hypothetical protein